MSVYIKGMEMPTSCYDCNCFIRDSDGSDYCCLLMRDIEDNYKRDDDCPLVPVPEHGDLIDYDFCMENYELLHYDDGNPVYAVRMRDINNAPTIIPADKEGERR